MFPALLFSVGFGLITAVPADSTSATANTDLESYEALRMKVGGDPAAHIKLALWCEAHELKAEEMKHLALAVLHDPKNTKARGLMGLASYRGSWQRPDAIAEKIKADEKITAKLAEYTTRRSQMADTAEAHWKMALWCKEQGLEAETLAHLTAVTRRDPGRDAAWIRLGCKKQGNRWVSETQLAAEKAESDAQKKAYQYWRTLLVKWRGWLGEKTRRADAEKALAALNDPRAARSVWEVFGRDGEVSQRRAVQILNQIDARASTEGLALLATWGASSEVRRIATESIRLRDPREYVGFLLSLLRDPLHIEEGFIPISAESYDPALVIQRGDTTTIIDNGVRPRLIPQRIFTQDVPFDPFGQSYASSQVGTWGGPMLDPRSAQTLQEMIGQPQNAAAILSHPAASPHGNALHGHASQAAANDLAASQFVQNAMAYARMRDAQIFAANNAPMRTGQNFRVFRDLIKFSLEDAAAVEGAVRQSNSEIFASLNRITNQDLPEDREPWRKWYYDVQGYAYTPPKQNPKKVFYITIPSCFAAGTPVRTLSGLRPIEQIEVGDQVLAQESETGKLSFEPVTAVHHNPPGETLKVQLGNEEILPSIFHRFWRAGRGWAMARDLTPGDQVRTLGGLERVISVSPAEKQKVYNLDVASSHSFFVGQSGALVHDNSLPAIRAESFDALTDRSQASDRP